MLLDAAREAKAGRPGVARVILGVADRYAELKGLPSGLPAGRPESLEPSGEVTLESIEAKYGVTPL
jgi:hypothetical protein